jgi:hypothetical protein
MIKITTLFLAIATSIIVAIVRPSTSFSQNYTQTTRTPGYSGIYINTGPQNPLLNNLQAGWATEGIIAQTELTRQQTAQTAIQNQIMIEQAAKQAQLEQLIKEQQRLIEQLRLQQQQR